MYYAHGAGLTGGRSAAEYGGFAEDGDYLGSVGSGDYTGYFGLELSFEGLTELFDGLLGGVVAFRGGCGGGFHEVAVVFAGEAIAVGVEDEDGVYFWEEGRGCVG